MSGPSLSHTIVSMQSAISRVMHPVTNLAARFARFTEIRRQRRMLLSLNDRQLSDIGITRADAEEEYNRSFKIL
ncbi:MAG: DUF1127 domain-containing protein [Rhodospirillales bacterium]|nr:DUF1127 domain-containing protein [Rhodospirillales bacterium]